jgi:hypothetical protein
LPPRYVHNIGSSPAGVVKKLSKACEKLNNKKRTKPGDISPVTDLDRLLKPVQVNDVLKGPALRAVELPRDLFR